MLSGGPVVSGALPPVILSQQIWVWVPGTYNTPLRINLYPWTQTHKTLNIAHNVVFLPALNKTQRQQGAAG